MWQRDSGVVGAINGHVPPTLLARGERRGVVSVVDYIGGGKRRLTQRDQLRNVLLYLFPRSFKPFKVAQDACVVLHGLFPRRTRAWWDVTKLDSVRFFDGTGRSKYLIAIRVHLAPVVNWSSRRVFSIPLHFSPETDFWSVEIGFATDELNSLIFVQYLLRCGGIIQKLCKS